MPCLPAAARTSRRTRSPREGPLAGKDIIVVGGSAGGVDALMTLLDGLPHDLHAAVFAVIHIPPSSPGRLPEILQRRCSLRVAWAIDGEAIKPGRVYVAPMDRHLVVESERVRVTRAPRENHSRPAIDPLFRSAALTYGPRVIGVVLSGRLDDGTSGLWAVKERGGLAIVQDPDEAAHAEMPRNALEYTTADYVVPSTELGALLARLSAEPAVPPEATVGRVEPVPPELEIEVRIAMEADAPAHGVMKLGPATPYTCPECHGVLMRVEQGGIPRFRCHHGHAFALDSLLASSTEAVEAALWEALRAVEETVLLLREAAACHARGSGAGDAVADPRFEQKAREAEARAALIREAVRRHQALSLGSIRSTTTREIRIDDPA
jgi:two-component system chemotaxis response regulator CheB